MVAGRHYVLPLAGEILDQNEAHNHVRFRQAWERRIEDDDEEIMAILMAFVGTRQ